MDLSLSVRRHGQGATVAVGGEIDPCTGQRLFERALEVVREHGPWLSVDLAGVTFMDCGGVRALLMLRSHVRLLGGRLDVVSASRPVLRILGILRMDTEFAGRSEVDGSRDDLVVRESGGWRCG